MDTIKKNESSSFADMFEKSLVKMEKLQVGQKIDSEVLSIGKDCVFIMLSGKSEGLIDLDEFKNDDGSLSIKEGDQISAYFVQAKNGEMLFTTKIAGEKAGSSMLENAYQNQIPVEGLVEKEIKGGYEIKLGSTRAFCPYSQMGARRDEQAEYIGKKLSFKIQEYKNGGKNILVSNRIIEEEAKQDRLDKLKESLSVGMTINGTISSIQDYGAFVDIGGIQALLPISEIGLTRVTNIQTLFTVGQKIEAEIIKLDWKNERISISMKRLLDDPWDSVATRYPVDSKHVGTISRIAGFGVFVRLEEGIDGLVHESLLKADASFSNAKTAPKVGDSLSVQIIQVDSAQRRISLKLASSVEEDRIADTYMGSSKDSDTYNPFAALLKKK